VRAYARFLLPDGSSVELGHGDVIGRLWSAALQLNDARISEAHALISLRGDALMLLALRGRLAVAGKQSSSVTLVPGLQVHLARDLALQVAEVELPTRVLALEGDGLPRQVLNGVCSLRTNPRPELVPRYQSGAAAHIWSDGDQWRVRTPEGELEVQPDTTFAVNGRTFRAVAVDLATANATATRVRGTLQAPLRVVAQYDTVHVLRQDEAGLALSGLGARVISELVAFDGPVGWQVLAREIWPDEEDAPALRRKLDVTLARLRKKLRLAGVRTDLVRADGFGHFELFLYDGDHVEDRT
jgi:hypothetical protein